ncbi:MAG: STAS domain-containing protein [Planctomycetota bacterium]
MRIEEDSIGSDYAILRLRGEFDTPFVPEFEAKINALANDKKLRIVLNLRFLRLINSTALGALVRCQKTVRQMGGDIVISHPSAFCKDVFTKVGLDKLFKMFDDDAEAVDEVLEGARTKVSVEDAGDVLFSYIDAEKAQFAPRPTEIGRIRMIEEDAIEFQWNAAKSNLTNDDIRKLLEPGTQLRLKFKLPLAKKLDFIEVRARVESAELPKRGIGVRARARITEFHKETDKKSLQDFVQEMRFLKNELRKATEQ